VNNKAQLYDEIENSQKSISHYMRKNKIFPTAENVKMVKDHTHAIQEYVETVRPFMTVKPIVPPETVVEAGVYFKEQLYVAHKIIIQEANRKGIQIPDTIGFGDALPSSNEVPILLRKLEVVKALFSMVFRHGAARVNVVKMLDEEKYMYDGDIYREIGIRMDMHCSKAQLYKIVYELANAVPVIIVKDISVIKMKDGTLDAHLICAQLMYPAQEDGI